MIDISRSARRVGLEFIAERICLPDRAQRQEQKAERDVAKCIAHEDILHRVILRPVMNHSTMRTVKIIHTALTLSAHLLPVVPWCAPGDASR